MDAAQTRAFTAWVVRQSAGRARIEANLQAALVRDWSSFTAWYDDAAVAAQAQSSVVQVQQARLLTGALVAAYVTRVVALLTGSRPGKPAPVDLPGSRGGTLLAAVYTRPAKQFRYLTANGTPRGDVITAVQSYVRLEASTDVLLADRDAARQVYEAEPRIDGYRRVLHPELAKSGSCGLCIAASDRVYRVAELMPIHARCGCSTAPIINTLDPGDSLNNLDLGALYKAAGGTDAAGLKRLRYQVNEHGELGPVLSATGQHFRGRDAVVDDAVAAAERLIQNVA